MDFSYTPQQQRLIARVRELSDFIQPVELECEMNNGLTDQAHTTIRQAVLDAGLQPVNMPKKWGGAGLTTTEQILFPEGLGRLTNALWDTVWRPAKALKTCTPEQRERYLLPGIRGEMLDAIAVTEEFAGSDPLAMSRGATISPRSSSSTATPQGSRSSGPRSSRTPSCTSTRSSSTTTSRSALSRFSARSDRATTSFRTGSSRNA